MSVAAMQAKIISLEEELQSFQVQVDSALVGLGVADPSELPPLDASELEPKGVRKVLAAVRGFFGAERPPPPDLPEVPTEKRRKIEELRIRILQTEGVRKRIDQFRVEVQKKFSIPFACIVFVLIGAPLGMRARRGGIAVGFFSVAFFLFYYLCLIGGEQLADRGRLSPWLAMWLPNIVLGAEGLYATYRIAKSGFPIKAVRRRRA
jgi:lipopolysaccharide export system permease protein